MTDKEYVTKIKRCYDYKRKHLKLISIEQTAYSIRNMDCLKT